MRNSKERYQLCPEAIVAILYVAAKARGIRIEHQPGQRGRPPRPFRKILNSIWFRLRTGCQWKAIPESEHLCNGSTAHRWYKRLTEEGVFELAYCIAVALYAEEGIKKLKSLGIDCTICSAPLGGQGTGPNPTDRGKPGVKISILVDGQGRPVSVHVSPANIHDLKLLRPTLEKLAEEVLQKLTKPAVLVADKGYDSPEARAEALRHGLEPRIQARGTTYRRARKAERTQRARTERAAAWLKSFCGIRTCWSRYLRTYLSSVHLAASYLLLNCLPRGYLQLITLS